MIPTDPIKIDGLAKLNRSLRKMSKDAPKQLRLVGNEAAELVVDDARPEVPKLSGRSARTVKAASTRTAAQVKAGGARAPWYPWLDFGGRVGIGRSVRRTFIKGGRYIYPAYSDNRDAIGERLEQGLTDLIRDSGLEPS
ncbi:MAG TPA: hypothetical protein VK878_23200 [Candidatus Deferrimicrobiaceae bacterium]|nr:hypothetical protein [Candidatus Deferrimicrobiaceae bacterium]